MISILSNLSLIFALGKTSASTEKIPLIFDTDADYDDFFSLVYLIATERYDLKAVTLNSAGFGTFRDGVPNVLKTLYLWGEEHVPVSYGKPLSLSPILTFPLSWKHAINEDFQTLTDEEYLFDPVERASILDSDQLITKVLKESDRKVTIGVFGPATNLAIAFQADPSIAANIEALYLMGSAYHGENNVHIANDGEAAYCIEDYATHALTPEQYNANRPGCLGNDMFKSGSTEWNLLADSRAWDIVLRVMKGVNPEAEIKVISTASTKEMPLTLNDFIYATDSFDYKAYRHSTYLMKLAHSFTSLATEIDPVKWWDVHLAAVMAEEALNTSTYDSVCNAWEIAKNIAIDLTWRNVDINDETGEKNNYGSIKENVADGAKATFCMKGNVEKMRETFKNTLTQYVNKLVK